MFQLSYPAGEEIAGGTEVPGVLKGQDIALNVDHRYLLVRYDDDVRNPMNLLLKSTT